MGQERCACEGFYICVFWLPPTVYIYTRFLQQSNECTTWLGRQPWFCIRCFGQPPTKPTFITDYEKIGSLTRIKRMRSRSCPAAIERAQVFELDNMWLPPHYRNFIAATLAAEQPSERLRFPDNGVVLLGDFSFSTTLEAEEERQYSSPTIEITEDRHFFETAISHL